MGRKSRKIGDFNPFLSKLLKSKIFIIQCVTGIWRILETPIMSLVMKRSQVQFSLAAPALKAAFLRHSKDHFFKFNTPILSRCDVCGTEITNSPFFGGGND